MHKYKRTKWINKINEKINFGFWNKCLFVFNCVMFNFYELTRECKISSVETWTMI